MREPKLYPREYTFNIEQAGDHLEVHISPLNITVSTEPGKLELRDAMDTAYTAIEERLKVEYEAATAAKAS